MFAADEDDTNSVKPTQFDIERIKSLEIGDSMAGEIGNFRVLRYVSSYTILLLNHPKKEIEEQKDWQSVVRFLQEF